MAQDKVAKAQAQLVQAFKLRKLGERVIKEAEALEQAAESVLAAWDDPAIHRTDLEGQGKGYETPDSPINPKDEDELLNLIDKDKSAISDEEKPSRTKQNKGNNPFSKSKDKWSSEARSLKEKLS